MSKKAVTLEQLLENARQAEALTMQVALAAAASIEALSKEINALRKVVEAMIQDEAETSGAGD